MGQEEPGVRDRYPSLSLQGRGTAPKGQGEGPFHRGKTPDHLLDRSRALRGSQTEAEAKLWSRLRAGRLVGSKFRRQVPIGNYIADFVCPDAKLIVEVDGSQHIEQSDYDERRRAFLENQGYRVLRFWNNEVLAATDSVLESIRLAVSSPLPGASRLSLPPEGEGV